GRQAADAEVEMLALHGHLDSAVLGSPFLGDVDLTHDLDTRDHRRQQPARRAVTLHQHAVDAVADPDTIGERLNVNIAGAKVDGFLDDQIDEFDDGGVAFVLGSGRRGQGGLAEIDGRVGELLQHRVDRFRFRLAIMPVDRLDDLFAGGQDRLNVLVEYEGKL